jgi:hypothetical protein
MANPTLETRSMNPVHDLFDTPRPVADLDQSMKFYRDVLGSG